MITWSSSNFKEILPDRVSEFTNSLVPNVFNNALQQQYRACGIDLPQELFPLVDAFSYKLFMNISALECITSTIWKQPPEKLTEMMGGHSVAADTKPYAGLVIKPPPLVVLRALWVGVLALRRQRKAWRGARSNPDIDKAVTSLQEHIRDHLLVGVIASALHGTAGDLLDKLCTGKGIAPHALLRTPTQAPNIQRQKAWEASITRARTSTEPVVLKGSVDRFLQDFGHRRVYEMEVALPRPSENPDVFLEGLRQTAAQKNASRTTSRQAGEDTENLTPFSIFGRIAVRLLSGLSIFAQTARERSKAVLAKDADQLRQALLAFGRAHKHAGLHRAEDVFLLRWEELRAMRSGDLPDMRVIIAARKRKPPPTPPQDTFVQKADGNLQPAAPGQTNTLRGTPVSTGSVSGSVRVILSHADASRIQDGDIVVVHALDSGWSEVFAFAAGVIAETGGTMSHAAILLRENNIPAIFNVVGTTKHLADGDIVQLDGRTGVIAKSSDHPKGDRS